MLCPDEGRRDDGRGYLALRACLSMNFSITSVIVVPIIPAVERSLSLKDLFILRLTGTVSGRVAGRPRLGTIPPEHNGVDYVKLIIESPMTKTPDLLPLSRRWPSRDLVKSVY